MIDKSRSFQLNLGIRRLILLLVEANTIDAIDFIPKSDEFHLKNDTGKVFCLDTSSHYLSYLNRLRSMYRIYRSFLRCTKNWH